MTKVQDFIQSNQLPEERFLPVLHFEKRFLISDFGRIISIDGRYKGIRFLHPHLETLGYYNAQLRMAPYNRKCRVHELVGEHFCEMKVTAERMTWNHIDGIKTNNFYKNLEYISAGDNSRHAVAIGLHDIKGQKHHHAKLTENDVREIRLLSKTGLTHNQISEKFGICRRQAGDIINLVNWGWLK